MGQEHMIKFRIENCNSPDVINAPTRAAELEVRSNKNQRVKPKVSRPSLLPISTEVLGTPQRVDCMNCLARSLRHAVIR